MCVYAHNSNEEHAVENFASPFGVIEAYILQQASEVGHNVFFTMTCSKHGHTHRWSLPCLLLVYTLIAVHLTLAQRVLHPSLTLNVDVRIIFMYPC